MCAVGKCVSVEFCEAGCKKLERAKKDKECTQKQKKDGDIKCMPACKFLCAQTVTFLFF